MDLTLIKSIESNASSVLVDVCFDYIAMGEKCDIFLFKIDFFMNGLNQEAIRLQGHHRNISALKFVKINDEISLVTASSDYAIIWHLNEVIASHQNGSVIRGHILCSSIGTPTYLSHLKGSHLVSVVSDVSVIIINTSYSQNKNIIASYEYSDLSGAEFLNQSTMIVTSFQGHVNIINFDEDLRCDHIQSFNCSVTSVAAHNSSENFAVGSSRSLVHEFSSCTPDSFKQSLKIDLDQKLIHANEEWKRNGDGGQSTGHVIAMTYVGGSGSGGNELEPESRHLICATERALFLINCLNYDVDIKAYRDDVIGPPVINHASFNQDGRSGEIICAASCIFEPRVFLISISISNSSGPQPISMLSNSPLLPTSPLTSQSKLSKPNKPKQDQPVTFKKKIKSSGYTVAPRRTMFKPNTSFSSKTLTKPSPAKQISPPSPTRASWHGNLEIVDHISTCAGDCIVNDIAINDRSQRVACALSNTTSYITKLPSISNRKSKVLSGHNQSVSGCFWSHDNDVLLTYCRNGDVKLWKPPYTNEPCLSLKVECDEKKPKDLISAQFYYLDKFVLTGMGNYLYLYQYLLEEGVKDDVKRYLTKSKHKLVGRWSVGCAQNITCTTATNDFYSYIVLTCGSDRSVVVFDMNSCQDVYTFKDSHTRPVHSIRYSMFSNSTSETFVTVAPTDGIKLWDLRTQRCMLKFNLHQSNTKCEVDYSACGNFIATTTDTKSICIYDVRQTFPLQEFNRKSKTSSLTFTQNSKQLFIGNDVGGIEIVTSV